MQSDTRMTVNDDELERLREEAIVTSFKAFDWRH